MSLNEKHGITELSFLTNCFIAVLTDCYQAFHTEIPQRVWKKDFDRFSLHLRTRGLGYLCRDLPEMDTILLNGLSSGKVAFTRPMFGRAHKPSFLKGVWLRIFDANGFLRSDADPTAVFFIRQIASLAKKANITFDRTKIEKERADGFFSLEKDLRAPTKRWRHDGLYDSLTDALSVLDFCDRDESLFTRLSADDRLTREKYTYYQGVFDFLFYHFDSIEVDRYDVLTDSFGNFRMKHGPGATHNTSRFTDKWDVTKVSFGLNHIFDLLPEFTTVLPDVEMEEQSSRLVFVPKDIKGPRLIAAEPIMNQYFQQAVYSYIKNYGLRHSGLDRVIDFTRQDLSQDLARRASIDRSLCTIDLKDASDRLTCYLVERIFRRCPKFLNFLFSCRTPNSHFEGGDSISIKKFATQGNATTFPIQSVVYAAICIAVIAFDKDLPINKMGLSKAMENVRVFGDDIIVPNEHYGKVVDTLSAIGLKVNEDKSFSEGFFRESCGGDFYKGYNVTPIKIRNPRITTPESYQMLIDVSNDAYRAGLWNLSDYLMSAFPVRSSGKFNTYPLVPMRNRYIQGGGLFTYGKVRNSHLRSRWDPALHNIQLKSWFLVSKTWKVKRKPLSRAVEQQFSDISSPSWNPTRIQRSQSSSRIGWQ